MFPSSFSFSLIFYLFIFFKNFYFNISSCSKLVWRCGTTGICSGLDTLIRALFFGLVIYWHPGTLKGIFFRGITGDFSQLYNLQLFLKNHFPFNDRWLSCIVPNLSYTVRYHCIITVPLIVNVLINCSLIRACELLNETKKMREL